MKVTFSGLLKALALLHTVIGAYFFRETLLDWVQAGIFNAVEPHFDRSAAFWCLLAGWFMFLLAQLVQSFEKQHLALPKAFLFSWIALGVAGMVAIPVSGFPLVALAGWWALYQQNYPQNQGGQPSQKVQA